MAQPGQAALMPQPRFGSVNVIVVDVDAAARFLEALGVRLEPTLPDWATHHRSFGADVSNFDADLDSPSFARWWGGVPDDSAPGVVVNLRVDLPQEVDELHARAVELGADELKTPWDAFWGARYSVFVGPGPLTIGVMSKPDPARRVPPPAVTDFA